nr:MAG TPA: hypothetical protein [Caudoviricetes sp.]
MLIYFTSLLFIYDLIITQVTLQFKMFLCTL